MGFDIRWSYEAKWTSLSLHAQFSKALHGYWKLTWKRAFFGEFIQAQMLSKQIEGLKAMVAVSTICPPELGSFAKTEVASQNDAWSFVDLSSYRTRWRNFLRSFAIPILASQIFWAQRTNCGNRDYRLQPFNRLCENMLPLQLKGPSRYSCPFYYLPFKLISLRSWKWLRKTM